MAYHILIDLTPVSISTCIRLGRFSGHLNIKYVSELNIFNDIDIHVE